MNNQISKISYITDAIKGSSLAVSVDNTGWVEYAKSHCKVYASRSFPNDVYQAHKKFFVKHINNIWPEFPDNFGFVHHLAGVLKSENFIMPAFGVVNKSGVRVTCGTSRFAAHSCLGQDLSTFGLVVLSQKEFNHSSFVEITTTEQFNDFYNLKEVDYKIEMTLEDSNLQVIASVLRHTFYNVNDPRDDRIISLYQKDIENFWARFLNPDTNKIGIKIHCQPQHRQFIKQSGVFDVKFINEEPGWGFSHGKLLGAFRKDEQGTTGTDNTEFVMWLFDINEPFDLEHILPLMKFGTTCLYTENKKAVMFDRSSYTDFKIIGNIVK